MTSRPRLGATGEFPLGKLDESDEGQLRLAVAADRSAGVVRVEFGKPVAWLGFPPLEARILAMMLLRCAGRIDGIPTGISLNGQDQPEGGPDDPSQDEGGG